MVRDLSFSIEHINGEELTAVIRRAMDGDREACARLMRAYAEYILVSVHNLVSSEHDADDVAQDILVLVQNNIGSLQSPFAFGSWLRHIIVNTCLNHEDSILRRARLRATHEVVTEDDLADMSTAPDEAVGDRDESEKLGELIRRLPQTQRSIIFLRYYEGLSYREIARLMGIRIGSVSAGINRAKKALKKQMENLKEFDSEGRLVEGAAYGALIRKAIESDGSRYLAKGAMEKFCAKTAVADTLSLSEVGQATQIPVASSSARVAWIAGGSVAAACAALLLLHPPAPAPETAQEAVTTHTAIVTENYKYMADAEIRFGDGSPPYDAVNPVEAEIEVLDAEGAAGAWRIEDAEGEEVASGSGPDAAIPSLAPGRYAISWDVIGTSGAVSLAAREFSVD